MVITTALRKTANHTNSHGIRVRGTDLAGVLSPLPVILQMHDDDFPQRFFQDLATQNPAALAAGASVPAPVSHAEVIDLTAQPPAALYQPVQRMLNVAMIDVACQTVAFPRVDPRRVVSAGLVVRRVFRRAGINGGAAWDDPTTHAAWMKNAAGQWNWVTLNGAIEDLDPDPTLRPQLISGQAATDAALAKLALSVALTESTTPAFVAPPATCAAVGRTMVYGVIPTASSEVADAAPLMPPTIPDAQLIESLPGMLRSAETYGTPVVPLSGVAVDYHWLSDDTLTALYPPTKLASGLAMASGQATAFKNFTTALRMLDSVFGAFDGSSEGAAVLNVLNRRVLTVATDSGASTQAMGDFYAVAREKLLAFDPGTGSAPQLTMPTAWEWMNDADQSDLLTALKAAVKPKSAATLTPQGRFQDATRTYRVRMFLRLKGETPQCPTELIWSEYSPSFRIAAWFETGDRAHPPIPMPDPTVVRTAKPNCSFQVPGPLMGAMNNASLTSLSNGSASGSGLSLGWICGFNIPMITICAFFVLNIFLSLLNIVFFWLPFIKICIPFPMPSSAANDEASA